MSSDQIPFEDLPSVVERAAREYVDTRQTNHFKAKYLPLDCSNQRIGHALGMLKKDGTVEQVTPPYTNGSMWRFADGKDRDTVVAEEADHDG